MDDRQIAAATVVNLHAKSILARAPFRDRGFSDRTIEALVAANIDGPERLPFATKQEIMRIPGIGKALRQEIARYRDRFLPPPEGRP